MRMAYMSSIMGSLGIDRQGEIILYNNNIVNKLQFIIHESIKKKSGFNL